MQAMVQPLKTLGAVPLVHPSGDVAWNALLVTWIGVYALFWGVVTLMLAFRVRKWTHEHA